MSLYVGVNNVPKKVAKFLVGVNGTAKEVQTGYAGGSGNSVQKVYESLNIDEELTKVDPVKALTSGKITSDYIGNTVYLSNSAITCQEWIIADVNHDGTSGTVDLFSKYALPAANTKFSTSSQYYDGSNLDTYLETTVYDGFSTNIKNVLNNMNVASNETTIQRHVVAPSMTEVGNSYMNYAVVEGSIYPIFSPAANPNTKSTFKIPSETAIVSYWTRSRSTLTTTVCYAIYGDGTANGNVYNDTNNVVARIRFAKK